MNRQHAVPAFTAIALAVLFPVYWVTALAFGELSFDEAFRANVMSLGALDLLFVLIGVMEIYIYLSLRKVLLQQLHGNLSASLLLLMAVVVAVFHATVLFNILFAIAPTLAKPTQEFLVTASAIVAVAALFCYTFLGLILSAALLFGKTELPGLLKVFAVLLIICCLLQLSIVLGLFNVVLFPVILLVLAIYFMRGGHQVEVV